MLVLQTSLQRLQHEGFILVQLNSGWQYDMLSSDSNRARVVNVLDVAVLLVQGAFATASSAVASRPIIRQPYLLTEEAFSTSFGLTSSPTGSAVHQYVGYWRWMLFTRKAKLMVKAMPNKMKGTNIHPIAMTIESVEASRAVAPPGGCTVLVALITMDAAAQPKAPETHWTSSKSDLSWNSFEIATPTTAHNAWPMMAFRG